MLRIVGGVFLGTVLGFIMGVVLGIAIAFWLLPPPPGQALDGITPMIGIVFVGTVAGGPAGGLNGRPDWSARPPARRAGRGLRRRAAGHRRPVAGSRTD